MSWWWWWWWWCLLFLSTTSFQAIAQQTYVNNHQLDCYKNFTSTYGNICNGVVSSCSTYLTFRSTPPYDSATDIAYLLSSDVAAISSLNNISDVGTIPTDTLVLVPINCSCSGRYYQHNASYHLKSGDTYLIVANDTYQGLSTCQSLMVQNPYGDRDLVPDLTLRVPLRCACPTKNQTADGVKFLLSYLVTWRDSVSSIAERFGVEEQSILNANELSSGDNIYPFNPILVPLKTEPSLVQSPPPPAPIPSQSPPAPSGDSKSSKKWVFIGVGIGVGLFLLLGFALFGFLYRRRSRKDKAVPELPTPPGKLSGSADYVAVPESKSWSISSGVRYAIDSLTVYKLEDLQKATDYFSEENKIGGSVYNGVFKGDKAAVKMMKGDVSHEINILKKINHSNVIRLSGFCVHGGNTYLVYEYAENGSLSDWLQSIKYQVSSNSSVLTWKQRVQIAHDVADALNYLHNYTSPPYIHKNLKSSNILLDGNLRAKVSNFGLARTLEDQGGGLQLTRHVVGTQGYMAPEYIENGVITPKMDVFALGVVMLELLSGREAAIARDKNEREELLAVSIDGVLEEDNVREKLKAFIDPSLKNEYPLDLAYSMAKLAKDCVARNLNSRPAISEVFMDLSKILSSSLDWDPSDELERSTSLGQGR